MSQQALPCIDPPPPPRMIAGGFIFLAWVSSATKIFYKKKVDFVRDVRIGTHQNVVLRHNHLNPISTKLTSFDNNEACHSRLVIRQVSLRLRNCINN